jgi:hypothetical protein
MTRAKGGHKNKTFDQVTIQTTQNLTVLLNIISRLNYVTKDN